MIDKIKKELCTGCNACFNVCPQNCIDMIDDGTGFRYPKINYDKCTSCKLCIRTCPSLQTPDKSDKWENPRIFAAWSLDAKIRLNSTSGGIFTELAKANLVSEGLVVGARYNQNHLVEHYMIDNIDALNKLRQSKYVQSDIGDIFKKIEKKLTENQIVSFCGTPCQVAGLINYLKKPYENLITFDFICLGINSPKAYLKYLAMLEKRYKSKVERVWFKNKTYGWNRFSTRIDFENGKKYLRDRYKDLYMRGYIEENLYMRSCCVECKYKSFPRISDITLADFWGVGTINHKLDSDKGTSLVMINSEKGMNLFNSINDNIFCEESTLEAALPGNKAIFKSAIKNENSEQFLKMLDQHTFDESFKKFVSRSKYKETKRVIYRKIIRIKRLIKTFSNR